ncbi:flavin reductase family protein [Pendulispora albinea]|uniref:Flavin reductase family protein n=1 Tax=Pendulispora albinea TaxID=2741071 RepID=A0ABZ2MAM8_9BACT
MVNAISSSAFRESLAHFASGVTIVTMCTPDGPVGFTASAFTSVSLDPPLILVCVGRQVSLHDRLQPDAHFGVSILSQEQAWLASQFSQRRLDRFRDVPRREGPIAQVPLIEGALAQLECCCHERYPAGDHTIVLGRVLHTSTTHGRPLVHFKRSFGGFHGEMP